MARPSTFAQAAAAIDGSFIPEPLEQKALLVLEEAMAATAWVRGGSLAANGQRNYVEVPDHPTRVVAAVRLLEWRRGKPRVAMELTSGPGRTDRTPGIRDLSVLLAEEPEMVERIMETIIGTARDAGAFTEVDVRPVEETRKS